MILVDAGSRQCFIVDEIIELGGNLNVSGLDHIRHDVRPCLIV